MSQPMVKLLLPALLALAAAAPSRTGAEEAQAGTLGSPIINAEMDHWLMDGVDSIYRMKFDRAEESARKAIAINSAHPHPYLGLAGVAWTKYVYGTDQGDPGLLDLFEARTKETIDVGNRWLKTHPDDATALMAVGAAYGISSRLLIIRRQWIRGYLQGRKAMSLTRAAVAADPKLWDAYLGLGMYDYYTDVYPRFIGVLAKLVLRGNRQRGINLLKLVAAKGHFSRSNARILLVEIYTEDRYGARDPEKAVAIMKELRAEYPDSAMMHAAELVSLYEAKRYEDALADAKDYVKKARDGTYNPLEEAKGQVILGGCEWALGRTDAALEAFRAAMKIDFAGKPSRWAVWAHLKAGQLEDSLGRRAAAVADYRAVLDQPDTWGFRQIALPFMTRPFASETPVPIPPP